MCKFIIYITLLIQSTALFGQWTVIDTSKTHSSGVLFTDVHFFNDTTGIVVGFLDANTGVIIKTSDAGESWSKTTVNSGLLAICFPSRDTGYAVGYNKSIFKTIDGGNTWIYQNAPVNPLYWAYSVFFINNDTGFVGIKNGPGYGFLKTYDGGQNWINDTSFFVHHAHFDYRKSSNILYAISGGGGSKSLDKGNTWVNYNIPPYTNTSVSLSFINDTTGFATLTKNSGTPCYNYGGLIKTKDGGQTWHETPYDCGGVWAMDFPSEEIGYMVRSGYDTINEIPIFIQGLIYKTLDSGKNWHRMDSMANYNGIPAGEKMICTDTNTCYILGYGIIFKTTNGGGTISTSVKDTIKDEINEFNIYPNPNNGNFTLEIENFENTTIEIYNNLGQLILKNNLIQNLTTIDLTKFSKGMYFVKVNSVNKVIIEKIVYH
ncbi:MAG: T9SS type A sorting domain-containing protein [Flavobacteriales bacterium]|nr:T9SS type A sorting domain-containing protein [Flavobacteriales bacterium]